EPSPCGAGFMPAGGVRFPTAVAAAPPVGRGKPGPTPGLAASRRVDNAVLVHHRAGTARLAACWWLAEGLSSQRSDTDLVQRLAHAAPEAALRALVLGGQVDFLVPVDAVGEDDLLAGQAVADQAQRAVAQAGLVLMGGRGVQLAVAQEVLLARLHLQGEAGDAGEVEGAVGQQRPVGAEQRPA